jgi:hypothetical protein
VRLVAELVGELRGRPLVALHLGDVAEQLRDVLLGVRRAELRARDTLDARLQVGHREALEHVLELLGLGKRRAGLARVRRVLGAQQGLLVGVVEDLDRFAATRATDLGGLLARAARADHEVVVLRHGHAAVADPVHVDHGDLAFGHQLLEVLAGLVELVDDVG